MGRKKQNSVYRYFTLNVDNIATCLVPECGKKLKVYMAYCMLWHIWQIKGFYGIWHSLYAYGILWHMAFGTFILFLHNSFDILIANHHSQAKIPQRQKCGLGYQLS